MSNQPIQSLYFLLVTHASLTKVHGTELQIVVSLWRWEIWMQAYKQKEHCSCVLSSWLLCSADDLPSCLLVYCPCLVPHLLLITIIITIMSSVQTLLSSYLPCHQNCSFSPDGCPNIRLMTWSEAPWSQLFPHLQCVSPHFPFIWSSVPNIFILLLSVMTSDLYRYKKICT